MSQTYLFTAGGDDPYSVDHRLHHVQAVLDDRRVRRFEDGRWRRVVEYLVRWQGSGPEADEWVPASYIDAWHLIRAYRASQRMDRRRPRMARDEPQPAGGM